MKKVYYVGMSLPKHKPEMVYQLVEAESEEEARNIQEEEIKKGDKPIRIDKVRPATIDDIEWAWTIGRIKKHPDYLRMKRELGETEGQD